MVFQDLLTSKDDYLRASRALLREIIKQTKHEINFQAFCLGLMQERKEPQYLDMEFKVRGCPSCPVQCAGLCVAPHVGSGQSQTSAGLCPVRGPGESAAAGLGVEVGSEWCPAEPGEPKGLRESQGDADGLPWVGFGVREGAVESARLWGPPTPHR